MTSTYSLPSFWTLTKDEEDDLSGVSLSGTGGILVLSDIFSLPFLKKSDLFTKTKKRMVIKPIVRPEFLSQRRGPVAASYDAG